MQRLIQNAKECNFDVIAAKERVRGWVKGAVAAIKKLSLVEGKGANEFAPNAKTTRAEAVTVLLKMLAQKSK